MKKFNIMSNRINLFVGLFTVFLTLSFTQSATAQLSEQALKRHIAKKTRSIKDKSVELSADTIFNAGIPYAILKKEKTGTMSVGYAISAINGKLVLYVTTSLTDGISEFKPLHDYKVSTYTTSMSSKSVAKMVVKYQLLTPQGLDIQQYKTFQNQHDNTPKSAIAMSVPPKRKASPVSYNASGRAAQVNRNRDGDIAAVGGLLTQSGLDIGTYKNERVEVAGKACDVYSIYHLDGSLCAELVVDVQNKKTMDLTTQWGKNTTTLPQSNFKAKNLHEAVKHLAENFYL